MLFGALRALEAREQHEQPINLTGTQNGRPESRLRSHVDSHASHLVVDRRNSGSRDTAARQLPEQAGARRITRDGSLASPCDRGARRPRLLAASPRPKFATSPASRTSTGSATTIVTTSPPVSEPRVQLASDEELFWCLDLVSWAGPLSSRGVPVDCLADT